MAAIQADERLLRGAPAPSGPRGQIVDQPDGRKPAPREVHKGRGRQTAVLDIAGERLRPGCRIRGEGPGCEVDVEVQVKSIQGGQSPVPTGAMKAVQGNVGGCVNAALGDPGRLIGSVNSAVHPHAGYGRHDRRLSDRSDRMEQLHVVCRGQQLRHRLGVEEMSGIQMFHAGELGSWHGLQKCLSRNASSWSVAVS